MRGYNDEFIAQRIIWKYKTAISSESVECLYETVEKNLPKAAAKVHERGELGYPVLAFIESESQWTLLGTEAITYSSKNEIRFINLDLIEESKVIAPAAGLTKLLMEYHEVTEKSGKVHIVWTSPGAPSLAFGAILLMLKLLQRAK